MKIKLRKLDKTLGDETELWLFLHHTAKDEKNYDFRWAIGYRKRDNWYGVIALFPETHENAIDRIAKEMELAKQAIILLKGKLLEVKN